MLFIKTLRHLQFLFETNKIKFRSYYYTGLIQLAGGKAARGFWLKSGSRISLAKGCEVDIGENFTLAEGAQIFVGPKGKLKIEANVFIGRYTTIVANGSVVIGHGTQVAHLATIIDSDHEHGDFTKNLTDQGAKIGSIKIGNNVWIGANAVVLKNTKIGNHTVIGASAVVTKDIGEHCVAVGNPAKVV